MSQVEKIAALQEAHWDLENQTARQRPLLNNAIMMFDATRMNAASMPLGAGRVLAG
jgi:hypothetical protein